MMTASHSSGFFWQESAFNLMPFNIRGLTAATKWQQLCEDLPMYRASVACFQETKWSAGLDDVIGDYGQGFCNSLETGQRNTQILEGVRLSFSPTANSISTLTLL